MVPPINETYTPNLPLMDSPLSKAVLVHRYEETARLRAQRGGTLRYSQVLLSSSLRQAGSSGLMCCNFCAKITWILGTNEAGGLCTLCSSAVSIHSMGSRAELSLRKGTARPGLETFHTNFSPAAQEQLESGQARGTPAQTASAPGSW